MLRINELKQLDLGVQGDSEAQAIVIDVNDWLADHPNGSVTIWHKRNGESVPSATGAEFDPEAGTVTWIPTDTDTYYEGEGLAEIRLVESNVIKKTRPVKTNVGHAVTGVPTPHSSGWQSYINAVDTIRQATVVAKNAAETAQGLAETAQGLAETAQENAEDAQAAAETAMREAENAQDAAETAQGKAEDAQDAAELATTRGPYIDGGTGKWMVWDGTQGKYINTGVNAQGPKGDPGSIDNLYATDIKMAEDDSTKVYAAINAKPGYDDLASKADKQDTVLLTTLSRGRDEQTTEGTGSIAFGYGVEASGNYSYAYGTGSQASGENSHAEGRATAAAGDGSHAEGQLTYANGESAHAEGLDTLASGKASHAEGYQTTAAKAYQHVFGKNNVADPSAAAATSPGNYIEIVGNGTDDEHPSNARALDWSGNEYIGGDLYIQCNSGSGNGKKVAKQEDVNMYGTLADGTDLDTLVAPNKSGYLAVTRTYGHHPRPGEPTLLHVDAMSNESDSYVIQTAYTNRSIYVRRKFLNSGTDWTEWKDVQMGAAGWQPTGTNIDDLTDPGIYGLASGSSYSYSGTFPDGVSSGILEVIVPLVSGLYALQRLQTSNAIYIRFRNGSSGTTWGSWYALREIKNTYVTIAIGNTDVAFLRKSGNVVQMIFRSGNFDADNNGSLKLTGTSTEVVIPEEFRPAIGFRINNELDNKRLEILYSGKIQNVSGSAMSNVAVRFTTTWVI